MKVMGRVIVHTEIALIEASLLEWFIEMFRSLIRVLGLTSGKAAVVPSPVTVGSRP
jgi:hypothetical protein